MVDAVSMPIFILFSLLLLGAVFGDSKPESIANQRKLASESEKGVSVSIDCGADDDSFIETGVKQSILPEFETNTYLGDKLKTLRSFPEGRRNCYTIRPANAKTNQKYHIVAFFSYGNYDNQNHNPAFDLHVGVNKWTTVKLEGSSGYYVHEIIYVSDTEYVDVCLVKTGFRVPFISRLELRGFDDSLYPIEPRSSLIRDSRAGYDIGGSGLLYFDKYVRYWSILNLNDGVPFNTTEKMVYSVDSNPNSISDTMWSTANYARNASNSLDFNRSYTDISINQLHIYFYFAEIEDVQPREMTISLNDGSKTSVKLDHKLTPVTIGPLKINVTSVFKFSIESGVEDLPPILNAFEILELIEFLNHPTDYRDVAAMKEIKKIFDVTDKNWEGDPCGPADLMWEGVECSKDGNPPRIISLNLKNSSLTGELPASLSDLTAIQSLDLSDNMLSGSLPPSLAQLVNLNELVLSGNNLTGPVPSELRNKFKDAPEKLRLDGNQLCTSNACNKTTKTNTFSRPLIAAVVIFFVLVITLSLAIFWRRKRQGRGSLEPKDRVLSYSKIASITKNFKTVIGEGGFGMVYHGVLNDQTQVAVKMLSKSSRQGPKEFRAEAQLLMIVHHRNLVSLVGYCDENGHMGLVYEYMANGNLQQHLSGSKDNVLNWRDRVQIAVSSAQGLEYLHNGCKPPIVHRDLKPANILLDEKMQAKISDFGLSKAFSSESMSYMETNPAGTLGYLDPEYQSSGNLNKKSDVYSFGIILLEIITGQPAIIKGAENHIHIIHWVNPKIRIGDIGAIVDPRLHGEFNSNAAWKAVEVAMSCVEPTGIQRPDMSDVLVELKEALQIEMCHQKSLSVESLTMRSTDCSMGMESVEFGEDMTPQAR